MQINVNGVQKNLSGQVSIAELIEQMQLDVRKIAIECNLSIILPKYYATTYLNSGDNVEIVEFIGGG